MAKDDVMSARTTLWYLVFVGFAVNYMIRINTNITIVAMIKQSDTEFVGQTKVDYACYAANDSIATETGAPPSLDTSLLRSRGGKVISPEQLLLRLLKLDSQEDGFDWNDYQQGVILGAFYWLHWITQIPGGILARRYGTKLVFGASNVIGCWLCFLMPIASYWDYRILVVLRVVQGLICGLAWPAMHHMAGQWIPPNERSKFVTAYLGSSIGVALNFPLFGFIIAHTSWEYVYHFCGIFGTVWYVAWLYLVYDSPSEHPRIHPNERKFIESSLGISDHGTQGKRQPDTAATPWKRIILSKPMWITVIAQWGGIWGLFTLMTQAPTYFNNVHGWNIEMTGLLSGIPHLCRMLFAYVFSIIGDHLLKHELMSRTGVRKMGGTMCCVVNGIFVFALAYSGCNSLMATIFLTLATTVHGAVSTGPLANLVDMSPRYAGILLGFSGMITVIPGFVSPIIVGMLGNHTVEQWRIIFLITSATLIVCGLLYMVFADSSQQSWNSTGAPDDGKAEELEGLQTLNNDPRNIEPELDATKEHKTDGMIRLSSV